MLWTILGDGENNEPINVFKSSFMWKTIPGNDQLCG